MAIVSSELIEFGRRNPGTSGISPSFAVAKSDSTPATRRASRGVCASGHAEQRPPAAGRKSRRGGKEGLGKGCSPWGPQVQ